MMVADILINLSDKMEKAVSRLETASK